MLLLAHSVADSLGVDDASSHKHRNSLVSPMIAVLSNLVREMNMIWSNWFCLSSSVLLGFPFDGDERADGGTVCAIQHGNLTTIAGWLGLNQKLKVEGSFSLRSGEGKLETRNDTEDGVQFRGLMKDYAFVLTEGTEQISNHFGTKPKASKHWDPNSQVSPDSSKVEYDLILVHTGEQYHQLLMRIRTDHYSRIIDPAQAMRMAAKGLPSYICSQNHLCQKPCTAEDGITTFSFDDMLGRWQSYTSKDEVPVDEGFTRDRGRSYRVSHLLDSHLKLNVAYAPSDYKLMVINREGPCIGCAMAHCEGYDEKVRGRRKEIFIASRALGKKKTNLITSERSRKPTVCTRPESA
jgi:hypothetical protein